MSWCGPRIYAVTNRNKLFNGALVVLVAANLFFGMYSTVRFALAPRRSPDVYSFICGLTGS